MRTTKKRGASQRGGNLGHIVTFGAPLTPDAPIGNTSTVVPMSSCLATSRFGEVPFPTTGLGLPGMSGGRRGRKGRKGSRKQCGGRYSFDLSNPSPVAAAPWAGGIPPVMRIPCESAVANPLNPVQMGGVGGVDSAFYAAPTAGYTNTPSAWVGSTGAPSLLQNPYDARTMNPACLTTGGRRKSRASRKKASRKKASRKRKDRR